MKEDIIRMAKEAGFETDCGPLLPESASIKVGCLYVGVQPLLERFFHMAQAAEREACAKVVLGIANNDAGNPYKQALRIGAEAIRRRSEIDSIVQNERSARGQS